MVCASSTWTPVRSATAAGGDQLGSAVLTSGRYLPMWSIDGTAAVYDLASNAALGETYAVGPGAPSSRSRQRRRRGPRGDGERSVSGIDLTTGSISHTALRAAYGTRFTPLALFPADDGLPAPSSDHVLAPWADGRTVDELYLGSVDGVVGGLWQGAARWSATTTRSTAGAPTGVRRPCWCGCAQGRRRSC